MISTAFVVFMCHKKRHEWRALDFSIEEYFVVAPVKPLCRIIFPQVSIFEQDIIFVRGLLLLARCLSSCLPFEQATFCVENKSWEFSEDELRTVCYPTGLLCTGFSLFFRLPHQTSCTRCLCWLCFLAM